jgi:hypothetical protein
MLPLVLNGILYRHVQRMVGTMYREFGNSIHCYSNPLCKQILAVALHKRSMQKFQDMAEALAKPPLPSGSDLPEAPISTASKARTLLGRFHRCCTACIWAYLPPNASSS